MALQGGQLLQVGVVALLFILILLQNMGGSDSKVEHRLEMIELKLDRLAEALLHLRQQANNAGGGAAHAQVNAEPGPSTSLAAPIRRTRRRTAFRSAPSRLETWTIVRP